jgi:hypothetical protein
MVGIGTSVPSVGDMVVGFVHTPMIPMMTHVVMHLLTTFVVLTAHRH